MRRYAVYAMICCLGVTAFGSAGAENLQMEEILIKGEKESPREESLSVKEVRESPARDMGEALKQVEGISCVRKGAIANDVVLRGFQKDNINVLVDGVRLHGACPSRMDPPAFHYDFAEVEQVKVIKGPYDLENPGGLGGMIDARTKSPGKGVGAEVNATYGSYNSMNASATASYGNDLFDLLGGYAFKYSEVPEDGKGKLITQIYPATSVNRYKPSDVDSKAYLINTGWFKFGLNPTASSRTELGYTYQDADHVLYPYLKMDADYDRAHRLNWTYRAGNLTPLLREFKLQAYWDKVNHLMDDRNRVSSLGKPRPYSMQTDASTQVVGAKINTSMEAGPGTLKAGIDYYNRNWDAVNIRSSFTMALPYSRVNMIPDVFVDNVGMYLGYELPFAEKFTLTGGLRGDVTWVDADQVNNLTSLQGGSRSYGEVGGNLQLTYRPVKEVELFTGFGRGARTPDPQELYIFLPGVMGQSDWSGNPELRPTMNHQFDLGAKYATDRFFVNAALFYSFLSDYINFEQAGPTLKRYTNVNASMWGAELGSQVSLPYDLFVKGTLSYVEGENRDGHRPLSEIPPLKGILSVRYDNGTYFFEAAENFAARQDRVDRNLNEQETAGWLTTDLKTGMNYGALSVYAGINNLLDKYYFSHLSYLRDPFASGVGFKVPENGRNFYVTMSYKF